VACCRRSVAVEETEGEEDLLKWGKLRWLRRSEEGAGRSCYRCEFLQVWPAAVDGDELPLRGGEEDDSAVLWSAEMRPWLVSGWKRGDEENRLVMLLAEGEEKKVCVQRGPVCLAESESNQREDGRSQNGGRFGLSLAKRGEVAGYGR